jgi:predicted nucleic acid-binding protein
MTASQSHVEDAASTGETESVVSAVHLDTSFLIKALVPGTREDQQLRAWLQQGTDIAMSSVAWAEFLCGPVSRDDRRRARTVIGMPLTLAEEEATRAAELFNASGRRRGSLPDCLIAATALKAGAAVATSNPADFRRFERAGLTIRG